ncbi:hypothetical protein [Paenibacillus sp. NEAU-GSW1]|uniref:hypothetical protein n=1 Tax=Paenibacillus sp. NEAU-GSW1 TaxID=2682486 RepID=UPI00139E98DF|nr:hypothetical protein [Paenibacillus sp. NEAU-GSW1]MUT67147.1 hypothetical protein [Paenibacillus sp. NEAU-GSW1]
MNKERIAVVGSSEACINFIRQLLYRKLPFTVLTNNKQEAKRLHAIGASSIIQIQTGAAKIAIPEFAVQDVYIFESSLALSCRYLQICRQWTSGNIYIITHKWNPRAIYKGLGADHVIYTQAEEVGFLLADREPGE